MYDVRGRPIAMSLTVGHIFLSMLGSTSLLTTELQIVLSSGINYTRQCSSKVICSKHWDGVSASGYSAMPAGRPLIESLDISIHDNPTINIRLRLRTSQGARLQRARRTERRPHTARPFNLTSTRRPLDLTLPRLAHQPGRHQPTARRLPDETDLHHQPRHTRPHSSRR